MSFEMKLKEFGLVLPEPQGPLGSYVTIKRFGSLIYTSGSSCFENGKLKYEGRLGQDLTLEEGYDASKLTILNLLSQIRAEIDSLDNIEQIIKVMGFINSSSDFIEQPLVLNGASDLLVSIFGEHGMHARSAVGVNVLPMNIPVEIEMIVKIKEESKWKSV